MFVHTRLVFNTQLSGYILHDYRYIGTRPHTADRRGQVSIR